jgi:hypothetical protein
VERSSTVPPRPGGRCAAPPALRWAGCVTGARRGGCPRRPHLAALQAAPGGPVHTPPSGGSGARVAACAARGGVDQRPGAPGVPVAALLQPCDPVLVVPPRAEAPPGDRIARARRALRRGLAWCQPPDDRPVAAPPRLFGPALAGGPYLHTQLGLARKACGPVLISHEDVVSRLGGNMLTRWWWRSPGKWRPSSGLLPARCHWCANFRVPLWFTLRL